MLAGIAITDIQRTGTEAPALNGQQKLYSDHNVATLCGFSSCFVLFIVLLLYLVDPVYHCGHLDGEEGDICFACFRFAVLVQSVMECLLFLLVSLVGCTL